MAYDPNIHRRRSIRLRGHDYSRPGAYYVTICVEDHKCLLGEVALGQMKENDAACMVDRVWKSIPTQFPTAELDEYIVMPNHFHGIIKIVGARLVSAHDRASRGRVVGAPLVVASKAPQNPRPQIGQPQGVPYAVSGS